MSWHFSHNSDVLELLSTANLAVKGTPLVTLALTCYFESFGILDEHLYP